MNIVLVGHPADFLGSQSMPKMVQYITRGMEERGYSVAVWAATPFFQRATTLGGLRKWLGYVDQFVLFSFWIKRHLRTQPADTLFFFTDQALSPWVWLVRNRPHLVLVSDLLAIRSAHGEFPQNATGFTGRIYQRLILGGLRAAHNFIAVSKATKHDLQRLTGVDPKAIQLVYNGLNYPFTRMARDEASAILRDAIRSPWSEDGFLFHVGGNQWYKNRRGVLALYRAYVHGYGGSCELWIAGGLPSDEAHAAAVAINAEGGRVRFLPSVSNEQLRALYSTARLFLFPSLAEGFGWPIAEAMACGCPVLTTDAAPMTEVGGDAAYYFAPAPFDPSGLQAWAGRGAQYMHGIMHSSEAEQRERVEQGSQWVRKFATATTLDHYAEVCERVLQGQPAGSSA